MRKTTLLLLLFLLLLVPVASACETCTPAFQSTCPATYVTPTGDTEGGYLVNAAVSFTDLGTLSVTISNALAMITSNTYQKIDQVWFIMNQPATHWSVATTSLSSTSSSGGTFHWTVSQPGTNYIELDANLSSDDLGVLQWAKFSLPVTNLPSNPIISNVYVVFQGGGSAWACMETVPEPASLVLAGLGLVMISLVRRRRR